MVKQIAKESSESSKARKTTKGKQKVPRSSLDPEFDVPGPWDDRDEPVIWIRCSRCGCTSCYEEGDSEAEEILFNGYGLKRKQPYCACGCHWNTNTGVPLKVKREVR